MFYINIPFAICEIVYSGSSGTSTASGGQGAPVDVTITDLLPDSNGSQEQIEIDCDRT